MVSAKATGDRTSHAEAVHAVFHDAGDAPDERGHDGNAVDHRFVKDAGKPSSRLGKQNKSASAVEPPQDVIVRHDPDALIRSARIASCSGTWSR